MKTLHITVRALELAPGDPDLPSVRVTEYTTFRWRWLAKLYVFFANCFDSSPYFNDAYGLYLSPGKARYCGEITVQ